MMLKILFRGFVVVFFYCSENLVQTQLVSITNGKISLEKMIVILNVKAEIRIKPAKSFLSNHKPTKHL